MSDVLNGKILVVDDHNTMIRITTKFLNDLGFKDVDTANDGKEALGMIKENEYALVLSDWNMEPVTGLELLKEVRAIPGKENLPFVMVTAESKPANVLEAKKAGVSNYIAKPFSVETLKSKVESVLGKIQ